MESSARGTSHNPASRSGSDLMSCGHDHRRRLAALVATLASERSPRKHYCLPSAAAAARAEEKFVVSIPAVDGPPQKVTVVLPSALAGTAPSTDLRPLVVSLHTWGGDHTQKDNEDLAEHAPKLGWIYIFPDFQGPNNKPEVRNVSQRMRFLFRRCPSGLA